MIKALLQKIREKMPSSISRDQAKDTGMAMILICLLVAVLGHRQQFISIAIILLLINMIWPRAYHPLAWFWFGFASLLGNFVSKILFSLVFIIMVIPVGLLRQAMGKDPLKTKMWKKGRSSVLTVRDHRVASEDILHPY